MQLCPECDGKVLVLRICIAKECNHETTSLGLQYCLLCATKRNCCQACGKKMGDEQEKRVM